MTSRTPSPPRGPRSEERMRPIDFFLVMLSALIAILVIDRSYRLRRARLISGVGGEFRMSYSPLDRFALTERLMTAPDWSMRASDLAVKDVLYATQGGIRCFVATVKCRWSLDQDPSRFIVRLIEPADPQAGIRLEWFSSDSQRRDVELYRTLLANWADDLREQ